MGCTRRMDCGQKVFYNRNFIKSLEGEADMRRNIPEDEKEFRKRRREVMRRRKQALNNWRKDRDAFLKAGRLNEPS